MKRGVYLSIGCLFIIIGMTYVVHAANNKITGGFILDHMPAGQSSLTGLFFLFVGAHFLSISRKRKRGQAAMEFLMTYGWAILASITAISVLAYFGVFGGGGLYGAPLETVLSAPLESGAISVVDLSEVQMEITNSAPYSITITGAEITGLTQGSCTFNYAETPVLNQGQSTIIHFTCSLQQGQTFNGNVAIQYTKQGSQLPQSSSGITSGKVPQNTPNGPPISTLVSVNGDTTPPYIIPDNVPLVIQLTTNRDSWCYFIVNDLSYNDMASGGAPICEVTGSTSHTCTYPITESWAPGFPWYVSCGDAGQITVGQSASQNLDIPITVV